MSSHQLWSDRLTQLAQTGSLSTTIKKKKDLYNKRITFVSKITLNNKYAKQTIQVCGKKNI